MALKVRQEELKRIMKARNLNIDQLAKELGVSRVYVQRILKEDLPVGAKFIEGLLELTKYTFDFLFYFDKKQPKVGMLNFTGNAPENPVDEFSNVKIGKVSFEKTKGACEASGEFEKRKEAQCVKPQTSGIQSYRY